MAIELDSPNIGNLEKEFLNRALDQGYLSTFGPYVSEFEQQFSKYLEVQDAVSIQSGTAALHMALYVLGIGPGDEVVIPALTFSATLHAVLYVGATPVIVDVDRDSWCISVDAIEHALTDKTKAIIPVHLYGNMCAMDQIIAIANKHNFFVIEDAAESLGASYEDRPSGTMGDMGCFSFNGNKIMTTGGGGVIVSKDPKRLARIRFLINQANACAGFEPNVELGFNYRMTNMTAILGLAQLKRLEEFLNKKIMFHDLYVNHLNNINEIRMQKASDKSNPSWWFTSIILSSSKNLTDIQKDLREQGIPSRRLFNPLSNFKYAKDCVRGGVSNANFIYEKALCLPSSTCNAEGDIIMVCDTLKEVIA